MVTPQMSDENKGWWKDERYAIYDLNVNSAIAHPAHDERLPLSSSSSAANSSYTVRGYAYGGGGRRISRVELSLDQGASWRLASIDYPEDRYRDAREQTLYGGVLDVGWRETSFCWCFWEMDVTVAELKEAKDMVVRCMDEGMNLQPRDMYWSVLGMMNNPWFRVVIHNEQSQLRFEHPTQPALMPGGWMERVKKAGGLITNGFWGEKIGTESQQAPEPPKQEIKMTKDDMDDTIELDELRKHDNAESPWFVVNGHVYDGTAFLSGHPGGAQSIISAAGIDATDEFMAIRKSIDTLWQDRINWGVYRQRNGKGNDARLPYRLFRRGIT
jgi:nitrate reductase (NAD(P)H)